MDRSRHCTADLLYGFRKEMREQVWQENGLMLANAFLVAVVVVVSAYVPRGRRHPLFRFLFVGASTLFLPIISIVAAAVGSQYNTSFLFGREVVAAKCDPGLHIVLVLVWTGLVLVIAINTSAVVAGDEREGRNSNPPSELFIKALWLAYLMFSAVSSRRFLRETRKWLAWKIKGVSPTGMVSIFVLLYALTAYKLFQRYLAFFLARRSVALGRNPRLIVGYMAELRESHPPALVVKGEETVQIEELPTGYIFKGDDTKGLVTLDRVWLSDGMLLRSAVRPKDLCFSFALFKLLRCRFAKYSIHEAGFTRAHKFFRSTYLLGEEDYERVFLVITDELSFIYDYYYSSLPVSFSNSLLPFHNILISLLSIGYCSFIFVFIGLALHGLRGVDQIMCLVWCPDRRGLIQPGDNTGNEYLGFGSNYFDAVPVFLVLSVVVLSEIKDIVAYVCSNWTKVYLVCKYVSNNSWQRSPLAQRCIGFMFYYCRCKLVTHWDDKMNHCSVLKVHPVRSFLRLPEPKKKVRVPREVKAAIFEALKGLTREQAQLGALMHIRLPIFPVSGSTTDISKGTADTILAWHIATSVFEANDPEPSSWDPNKIATTHLSRYCAYLVACRPELLPDDDKWCISLYKAVNEDAGRVLSNHAKYEQLVQLNADANHEVLKNGAKLGKQLVDSETTWKVLASFWAEMILYVAPSENLEGHAESIARGGELITLLWALLAHAGIVGRLNVANATDCGAGARV